MTNELEKQFFDTFGIEKEFTTCEVGRWGNCPNPKLCIDICSYKKSTKLYPQITDSILLKLQNILLQHNINIEYSHFNDGDYYCSCSIPLANGKGKTFKEALLDMLISIGEDYVESCYYDGQDVIYNQVRTLFEEAK